jgi:hypothetical protein
MNFEYLAYHINCCVLVLPYREAQIVTEVIKLIAFTTLTLLNYFIIAVNYSQVCRTHVNFTVLCKNWGVNKCIPNFSGKGRGKQALES